MEDKVKRCFQKRKNRKHAQSATHINKQQLLEFKDRNGEVACLGHGREVMKMRNILFQKR